MMCSPLSPGEGSDARRDQIRSSQPDQRAGRGDLGSRCREGHAKEVIVPSAFTKLPRTPMRRITIHVLLVPNSEKQRSREEGGGGEGREVRAVKRLPGRGPVHNCTKMIKRDDGPHKLSRSGIKTGGKNTRQ